MEIIQQKTTQFSDPLRTLKGEPRAFVESTGLKTLWFNTGTLCNLQCNNCYIESSPKNDRLVYISAREVEDYLDQIKKLGEPTTEIAFTGGEPFMNPEFLAMMDVCLQRGFDVLVLTNAMKPMMLKKEGLLQLKQTFGKKLKIRVSLDHYSEEKHNSERGQKAWKPAIEGITWLAQNDFNLSLAGRTFWDETHNEIQEGFRNLCQDLGIPLDCQDPERLVLFPEMDEKEDTPEITTACWDILNVQPSQMMCASSRMVVKRKGAEQPSVAACTLLPYQDEFDRGSDLKTALEPIYLNHRYCSQFCVLGGGSCSQ